MLNYQRVVPKQVHTNDPIGQECAMLRVPRVPTCSTRPFGPDVVVKRRGSPRATSGTQQGVFSGWELRFLTQKMMGHIYIYINGHEYEMI